MEVESQTAQNMLNSVSIGKLKDDEYVKDGIIFCKKCDTPRMFVSEDKSIKVRCICKCQSEEQEELSERLKKVEEQLKFKQLQEASLLGERYLNVKFENTDLDRSESFISAFKRCKKFCDNSEEVFKKGLGMYLWGQSGNGKTHLLACMVNELSNKFIPCLFTNFFEIAKAIKKTFGRSLYSESEYVNQLANIPFLFIDDFGTERVQKDGEDNWLQERIYDVINKRYNSQKPTVFSSNLPIRALIEKQGIMTKTVDRVVEMSSAIIEIKDESYRLLKRKQEIPF